jgi:RNA polymerase sigma factor (sigma-70 family)
MNDAAASLTIRQIESIFEGGAVAGLTDSQLLERFVAWRDTGGEAAFSALVARHGQMVLHVCRQIVADRHLAEDAFQAVFVVLAHKAHSIRDGNVLGPWLYWVAVRTARKTQARLGRLRRREQSDAIKRPASVSEAHVNSAVASAEDLAIACEQAQALHAELARLPRSFRLPVVLCYFEGLSLDDVARRLRWPAGTVRSRLARARDKLRRGLIRRGVVLPAAAIAAALNPKSALAVVSPSLCEATARAAVRSAAGQTVSVSVTAVARQVLRSLRLDSLITGLTALLLGAAAIAAGYLSVALASTNQPAEAPADLQPQLAARANGAAMRPGPGRMFISGRVLDPKGLPVPNATAMAYARSKALGHSPSLRRMRPLPIGAGGADGSGRFRIDVPRTSSARHDTFGVVAIAHGFGAAWSELDPDADQPAADITLHPERVIQGRIIDLEGRPVRDVAVRVRLMGRVAPHPRAFSAADSLQEELIFGDDEAKNLPAWPQPATSDAEGRFVLHGLGRGLRAFLRVEDHRFASQRIMIDTGGDASPQQLTIALAPAKLIKGRVTYADTGKPVPHTLLAVSGGRDLMEFETDDDGHFRANPVSGERYDLRAYPPAGQPYLSVWEPVLWPKAAIEQSVDLALPRGVVLHGKVTEKDSGQPVAGATVRYLSHQEEQNNPSKSSSTVLETAPDGSFQIGALPRPGWLSVMGPSDDYVLEPIGSRMVDEGQPGGDRYYSHANIRLDLKPGIATKEVNVVLRRGATVKGRVVGPDGQPVLSPWMFSRIIIAPTTSPWRMWRVDESVSVRNGRFELHGVALDEGLPVFLLEPARKLGATIHLSARSVGPEPVTARLEPCGAAKARLVDSMGKPVPGRRLGPFFITLVITPGPPFGQRTKGSERLLADEGPLTAIDPINYPNPLTSDVAGRLELPVLIPGATYRFIDRSTARDPGGPEVRKEFVVGPGQKLDLGDILIEARPR